MSTEENETETRGLQINNINETNWGFKGRNYLFLIGIDKYQHWKPLVCAVKDVLDFADLVTLRYQFEKSEITILKDEDATEKNILKAFNKLRKAITNEDNLVIYYSGHGHLIEDSGYWIPVDAQLGDDNEDEFINNTVILDKVKKINTLHTFLIVDACFSGSLIIGIKGSRPKSERYKSRRIFASGRHDQFSSDGKPGGNSPFASGILNELRNNTNPYITVSKLIAEVSIYVQGNSDQAPVDDRLRNSDDQGGDFIFHLRSSEEKYGPNTNNRAAELSGEGEATLNPKFPLPTAEEIAWNNIKWVDTSIRKQEHHLSKKEYINLLKELIKECKDYFQKYPDGTSKMRVKRIHEDAEMKLRAN